VLPPQGETGADRHQITRTDPTFLLLKSPGPIFYFIRTPIKILLAVFLIREKRILHGIDRNSSWVEIGIAPRRSKRHDA